MPELPEVETIKNELLPFVAGHRITGITLLWDGTDWTALAVHDN